MAKRAKVRVRRHSSVVTRLVGVGVLGLGGAFVGTLLVSQPALNDLTGKPLPVATTCTDGTVSSSSPTPGSHANPLADPVTICGQVNKDGDTTYGSQPATVTFWQTYAGHSTQETQLNGDIVLDVTGVSNGQSTTTKVYVPVTTVLGKAHSHKVTVAVTLPSSVEYSTVTGGYFEGSVTSNTAPIKLSYDIQGEMGKSGTKRDEFGLSGHAWIDPGALGTPIAPLLGNDGMEVVALVGIVSAVGAAAVIRRRRVLGASLAQK